MQLQKRGNDYRFVCETKDDDERTLLLELLRKMFKMHGDETPGWNQAEPGASITGVGVFCENVTIYFPETEKDQKTMPNMEGDIGTYVDRNVDHVLRILEHAKTLLLRLLSDLPLDFGRGGQGRPHGRLYREGAPPLKPDEWRDCAKDLELLIEDVVEYTE